MKRIFCAAIILTLGGVTGSAQQPSQSAGDRRDLSGIWSTFPGVNPVSGLKREVGGVAETTVVDRTAIRGSSARARASCHGRPRRLTSRNFKRR